MARYKDTVWTLPENGNSYDSASLGVLMDIRDELKSLNRLLNCTNFIQIPMILRGIRRKLPAAKKKF
jgi:hypothetical protein